MKNMICTFGDSIMKGVVSSEKDASGKPLYQVSEQSFVNRCGQRFGISIKNYACFGSTTTQGMKYIDRHEKDVAEADYILFEYGGNDCDHNWKEVSDNPNVQHLPKNSLDVFVKQYRDLIQRIRKMNGNPVIMSLPLIDPDRFFDHLSAGLNRDNILSWLGGRTMRIYQWHEMYNVELFKLARHLRVPIIDVTTPFLEVNNYSEYLCDDGIHPNEKGHALIADAIANNVGKVFA
ncbi:MAG: SGNH/GDSL hydrolase family protein [Bacteroidales bacterium]|nr:SGNH/GDSL hydrolase family protein [Bacteroidales bacterium]